MGEDTPVTVYGVRSAFLEGDPLGDIAELFVRRDEAEEVSGRGIVTSPGRPSYSSSSRCSRCPRVRLNPNSEGLFYLGR